MGHVSIVKLLLARDDVSLEAIRCGPRFASCVPQVLGEELAMEV